jgi:hypothetical protein
MANFDFQALMQKIMGDADFVAALSQDPEAALRDAGLEASDEVLVAVRGVDAESLRRLATAFKEDQAAAG